MQAVHRKYLQAPKLLLVFKCSNSIYLVIKLMLGSKYLINDSFETPTMISGASAHLDAFEHGLTNTLHRVM